jgi:hypothetical protein
LLIIWSILVVSLDTLNYHHLVYEAQLVDPTEEIIDNNTEDPLEEGSTDVTDIIAGGLRRVLKPSPKGGAGGGGDSCG